MCCLVNTNLYAKKHKDKPKDEKPSSKENSKDDSSKKPKEEPKEDKRSFMDVFDQAIKNPMDAMPWDPLPKDK